MEEGQSKHSVMGDMAHQNRFQIHKALMEPYDPETAPKIEQSAKNFYMSMHNHNCLNNLK